MTPNKKSLHTNKQFNRLEILAYHTERLSWLMKKFNVEESEQFILYTKRDLAIFINSCYNITRMFFLVCKYMIFSITFHKLTV